MKYFNADSADVGVVAREALRMAERACIAFRPCPKIAFRRKCAIFEASLI